MVASNIKVFLRVRPSTRPSAAFKADDDQSTVLFELEKQAPEYEVNNNKLSHKFRFDGLIPMQATQADVFDKIAKPVIDDVLTGVNGTIFAYGQTGSGKTFSITGGAERYEDRGMIPRTISYFFEAFRKGDGQYRMYISYFEIYNNDGYDLLRDDNVCKLEDLPKVQLREDEDGNMHLRNLSVNLAGCEEDALNLLFMGDTNRVVAETPMNDASTRSHCLFIVWVDSTKHGSDVVRRSKFHLVDLAGSERVSRTNVEGNLLKEAKYINLSLHYLEQVIVALHDRTKGKSAHVPYRNSMMTSVLRDSLGGNCKTTMLGCIATEAPNLNESISTCRFATRVAQIQNNAKVNEELDPNLLIARLKREASELKKEVQVAKAGDEGPLTDEAVQQCHALVLQYIQKASADLDEPFVCGSVERLRCSFRILRDLTRGPGGDAPGDAGAVSAEDPARKAALEAELQKLRLEAAQRDMEISELMKFLARQKSGAEGRPFITAAAKPAPDLGPVSAAWHETTLKSAVASAPSHGVLAEPPPRAPPPQITTDKREQERELASTDTEQRPPSAGVSKRLAELAMPRGARKAKVMNLPGGVDPVDLLLDQQKAYNVFLQSVKQPESVQENKTLLKERIDSAKLLGAEANQSRAAINGVKTRLEKLRTERAMTAARDDEVLQDGPEELQCIAEIDSFKGVYRGHMDTLRQVKGDIDRITQVLEQNKVRMQREFEVWFAELRRQTSLTDMPEDRKQELYEKIVGKSTPTSPSVAES